MFGGGPWALPPPQATNHADDTTTGGFLFYPCSFFFYLFIFLLVLFFVGSDLGRFREYLVIFYLGLKVGVLGIVICKSVGIL